MRCVILTEYKFDTKKAIEEIEEFSEYILENSDEYYAAEVIHLLMSVRGRLSLMMTDVVEAVAESETKKNGRFAIGPSETKKKK